MHDKALTPSLRDAAGSSLPRTFALHPVRPIVRSDVRFALGVSLVWLVLYNGRFWSETLHTMWRPSGRATLFVAALFVITLLLQSLLLLAMPTRTLMRGAACVLFVIAAASSYFTSAYGAVMNQSMIRNVFETDLEEIGGLLSARFLLHLVVFGVIPAVLVCRVRIAHAKPLRRVRRRATLLIATLAVSAAALFACSADFAVFFRQHKPVRYTLTPAAPIASALGLLVRHESQARGPLVNLVGPSERSALPQPRPLALFVVVGETARAANFSLGGYARRTNPQLQSMAEVVYFDRVTSCDTSTATSVPCMFSPLPRATFDVETAERQTNLLDALGDAGLDVEWRDNNAGCKGVCARVRTVSYAGHCPGRHCYDDVMLEKLEARLRELTRDTVFVFHQIGSHGPAYAARYPATAEHFTPVCRSSELQRCAKEEIVNAYDNSIVNTDAVLAAQIAILQRAADRLDGALLYVSDHGESLGEQGVYLHGLPYAFAPGMQKEVPMLLWTSAGFRARQGLKLECLRAHAHDPLSHDNLYHTVLGAAQTRNKAYDANLDVLASCRSAGREFDHE